MSVSELIQKKEGTIVDVRTPGEFMGGHVTGSVNIPLQDVMAKLDELKSMKEPLLLCCASGGRSGQASQYLASQGIDCHNAGSWLDVNYHQSQN